MAILVALVSALGLILATTFGAVISANAAKRRIPLTPDETIDQWRARVAALEVRNTSLNERNADLYDRLEACEVECRRLGDENGDLRASHRICERHLARARWHIRQLGGEVATDE